MKAYFCGPKWDDDGVVALVMAENAGKARAFSIGLDGLDCELIDIRVMRVPGADKHIIPEATETYCVEISSKSAEMWRDAGGHDFESEWCDSCGKAEMNSYNGKPEWKVCEGCGQCGECGCICEKRNPENDV